MIVPAMTQWYLIVTSTTSLDRKPFVEKHQAASSMETARSSLVKYEVCGPGPMYWRMISSGWVPSMVPYGGADF